MGGRSWHPSQGKVLTVLLDRRPHSARNVAGLTGHPLKAVQDALGRCWRNGYVLRTESMMSERRDVFHGRKGFDKRLKHYHLYIIPEEPCDSLQIGNRKFVKYDRAVHAWKYDKIRAQLVLQFLREHPQRTFFSKQIFEALKEKGAKREDIMTNVRRFQRNGLLYVRGYRSHDRETPFAEGYLFTWINQEKPREQAIAEAVERTDKIIDGNTSTNPLLRRVQGIRGEIVIATAQRDIVASTFLQEKLRCTERELDGALATAKQIYTDIKEVKVFNNYRYYCLTSISPEDLQAAATLKQNYLRKAKGKDNRVGHNWEAAVDWFIDKYMKAHFWTQEHRTNGMDPRRITLHLLKPVGDRRQNAEVDRVWEVTPGPIADPITYVLSCKWTLIKKFDLDDFLDVLRWSQQFGVDTPEGRKVKQGVIGWFAAGAFDPKSKIKIKNETISLAAYADRLHIKLLKAADINEKLKARHIEVTVQAVCRAAKNENEVRTLLEDIWKLPNNAKQILSQAQESNMSTYEFERMIEKSDSTGTPSSENCHTPASNPTRA